MHYIYIVKCSDGSLYTGYTTDLDRRMKEHNSNTGAKYTRGRTPVSLMYYEEFNSRSEATKRESNIKKLKREEKILLINDDKNKI